MIRYNEAFQANVKGTLCARFQLDSQGNPLSGDEDGTTFYFIELRLDSPDAEKIQKVTYLLDEASYWEPERESKDWQQAFAEEITSYGDFLVRVEVQMRTGRYVQQALLSEMLEAGHANDANPQIKQAIAYIRNN
jgi:hypothetical protein